MIDSNKHSNSGSTRSEVRPFLPEETAEFLLEQFPSKVDIAVVLGSGLGSFGDMFDIIHSVPTSTIPGYPRSTVQGHEGILLLCKLGDKRLLLFRGRVHGYEGYSTAQTTLTAQVAKLLGAKIFIATNAAGGLHPSLQTGDLMLVTDILVLPLARHYGLPLQGPGMGGTETLPRPFFSERLLELLRTSARMSGITLREGTYGFCSGPTYETRSEISFFRQAGADAAGMSTVPELLAARRMGMDTLGISCITNKAVAVKQKVSHEEVTQVAALVSDRLSTLLATCLKQL